MGDEGMRKARDYAWEHIAQRILDYYGSVLGGTSYRERLQELELPQVK